MPPVKIREDLKKKTDTFKIGLGIEEAIQMQSELDP
jgi:hypothetical protein